MELELFLEVWEKNLREKLTFKIKELYCNI